MQTGAIERVSVRNGGTDISDGSFTDCRESSVSDDGKRVAFACLDVGGGDTLFVRDRTALQTLVASVNLAAGVTAGSVAQSPSISADGRYVGFASDAGNLVAGDTNGSGDAFVRDLQASTTMRVSLDAFDAQIPGASVQRVDIAANCLAAFDTPASAQVVLDNNGSSDVYIRNWCSGTTELASADYQGALATGGDSDEAAFSADGRYVAFRSNADLVQDAPFASGSSVYVRDRVTGTVARAHLEFVEGMQFDIFALVPRLSDDGRQVAYVAAGSSISDQVLAVHNPVVEPLPIEDVAVSAFGVGVARDSFAASVSADGSKVVFVSEAQGFDRGWGGSDNDASDDVFVYDYRQNCVEQASMSHLATNGDCDGVDGKGEAWQGKGVCAPPEICSTVMEPSLEAGGNYAVFVTADAAVAKFGNETDEEASLRRSAKATTFAVVLRNLVSNATFRLGTGTAAGTGSVPRVAPGGGSVVFVSGAGLAGTDTNGQPDVYRQRIKPDGSPDGTPDCVSCKDGDNVTLPGGAGNPTINAGGTVVAFDQPNGGGGRDIVIRNLITGATQRAGTTGAMATRNSTLPTLDWSGTHVAFESGTQLAPADTNAFSDVYVFDIPSARLVLMSGGNGPSRSPSFAGDGKSLAYVTESTNLDPVDADANGFQDVHVQEVTGGTLSGGRRATLSRNRAGGYTDGASSRPSMSYNGTVVAFDSAATNLLGAGTDANAALDIFTRSVPFNADRIFEAGFE
jgi:Tol biopolymer transport system component